MATGKGVEEESREWTQHTEKRLAERKTEEIGKGDARENEGEKE